MQCGGVLVPKRRAGIVAVNAVIAVIAGVSSWALFDEILSIREIFGGVRGFYIKPSAWLKAFGLLGLSAATMVFAVRFYLRLTPRCSKCQEWAK